MRLMLLAILVAGCAETDPYARAGMWQPTGANSRNIAAQVATKSDLLRGRGAAGVDQIPATAAVLRMWEGNPKPLPTVTSKGAGG